MILNGTLEEDILNVFWAVGLSMNVQALSEALKAREIDVPLPYLARVLEAMTTCNLLEEIPQSGQHPESIEPVYQPTQWMFRYFRKPFQLLFPVRRPFNNQVR